MVYCSVLLAELQDLYVKNDKKICNDLNGLKLMAATGFLFGAGLTMDIGHAKFVSFNLKIQCTMKSPAWKVRKQHLTCIQYLLP